MSFFCYTFFYITCFIAYEVLAFKNVFEKGIGKGYEYNFKVATFNGCLFFYKPARGDEDELARIYCKRME